MHIDMTSGRVSSALQCPSPNCDDRPPDTAVELLVIHGISLPPGRFGGPYIDQLFTNRLDTAEHACFQEIARLRVSSHLLIRRSGELVQYVPLHRRAWHAGRSSYRGRPACNDYSIGIELEGTDERPYTARQYRRLAPLCRALLRAYPGLAPERIVGHCDIAPERKTDPGPAFDWQRLHRELSGPHG